MMPVGIDEAQIILRLIDAVSRIIASFAGAYFAFWFMQRSQAQAEKRRSAEAIAKKEEDEARHLTVTEQVEDLEEIVDQIKNKHKKKKRKGKCKSNTEARRYK